MTADPDTAAERQGAGELSYAELTDLVEDAAPAPEPAVLLGASPRLAVTLPRGRRPATLVRYLSPGRLDLDGVVGTPLPTFRAVTAGQPHPSALPIDLDISFERCGDAHHARVLYDPGRWADQDITAALDRLERVLRGAASDPACPLAELATGGAR